MYLVGVFFILIGILFLWLGRSKVERMVERRTRLDSRFGVVAKRTLYIYALFALIAGAILLIYSVLGLV